jgi:hypothetical protein
VIDLCALGGRSPRWPPWPMELAPLDVVLTEEMTGGGLSEQLVGVGEAPLLPQLPPTIEPGLTLQTPLLDSVLFGDFTEPWFSGLSNTTGGSLPSLSPHSGLGSGMV